MFSRARSQVNRLNSSNSLKNSPLLSGVVSTSNSNSNSRSGTPTPRKARTRESSASPPPHARASAPESTKSKNADQPIGTSRDGSPAVRGEGSEDMGVNLNSLAEFGIPPIPTGPCNPAVEVSLPSLALTFRLEAEVARNGIIAGETSELSLVTRIEKPTFQRFTFFLESVQEPSNLQQTRRILGGRG